MFYVGQLTLLAANPCVVRPPRKRYATAERSQKDAAPNTLSRLPGLSLGFALLPVHRKMFHVEHRVRTEFVLTVNYTAHAEPTRLRTAVRILLRKTARGCPASTRTSLRR